uniref:Uncharacterized protein n=1 Tax=Avena sativa TaxID=4498 RepID=A0ACD5WZG6_AVESA
MKQLHRQSSLSKQHRPHHRTRSLASYLVREHRLLFVLLGFLLASSFFLVYPSLAPHPSSLSSSAYAATTSSAAIVTRNPRVFSTTANNVATARRLPVGVRKKPLRVVVTGGAGFVGSHLVDKLLARGDSVIVVDNFFTGRKENLAHHLTNPRFELIRHDVVEPILLEVDQIYHLACPASPVHYKFNPIKTIKTNVMGTLNMLGLAKRVGARFLLTSTSEVYGDPLEHPQKESYWGHVNPIGVRSCYDEGKRTAETLTMDYHRGAGVEVKLLLLDRGVSLTTVYLAGNLSSSYVAQI